MSIFNVFSRKAENDSPTSNEKILKTHSFIQSSNFKGYKRIKLTTYGFESITKGIDALKKPNPQYIPPIDNEHFPENAEYIFDIKDKPIEIQQVQYGMSKNEICLRVFVDSNHVGTFFIHDDIAKSYYDAFDNNRIESVHIRFDSENIVGKEKNKLILEVRYSTYLFVKAKT